MATRDETRQSLLDGVKTLADSAANTGSAAAAANYAAAAVQLAESYAWLTSTSQPHGGGAKGAAS